MVLVGELESLAEGSAFRHFRIRMTKPAHDGDWYFAISGIEFYGHLIEGHFDRTATPATSPETAHFPAPPADLELPLTAAAVGGIGIEDGAISDDPEADGDHLPLGLS